MVPPQPSTSSTPDPTPSTPYRAKIISLPYEKQFTMINQFMHASNYKLIFTAKDSIGKAVINKKGTIRDSVLQHSGVYRIPCSTSGCNKPYFGRTMKPLDKRMFEHTTMVNKMSRDSALVQHMVSHPGHTFDMDAAKIIWRTRSKYESQLVEAACINRFPSCNISKGEIRVTPAMSAFTTYIAGLHRQSGRNTSPDSRGSITPPSAPLHLHTWSPIPCSDSFHFSPSQLW